MCSRLSGTSTFETTRGHIRCSRVLTLNTCVQQARRTCQKLLRSVTFFVFVVVFFSTSALLPQWSLECRSAHTLGVVQCTGRIRPVSTYIRTRTDPGGTGGDRGPKWTSLGRVSGRWGVFGLRGAGRRRGRHLRRFRSAVCAARPGGRGTVRAVAAHLRTRAGPGGTGGDRGPIFAFMGRSWAPWGPFFASRRRPARRRH